MDARRRRHLYAQMLRIRRVEETIATLYPQRQMRCPVHLCIGQEAVAVGVCAALAREDYVLGGHRSHGHYLAKGGDLKALLAELYGRVDGCCQGKGGSMHLVDLSVGFLGSVPIVGSTIPIAVGVALACALRAEPRVTVVFFGEAATEEGVFHEAINFASVKRLPIVFVCENNLYSVYSPLSVRQPQGRALVTLAAGHGVASAHGDGNDVLEVCSMAEEAAARARRGEGATFLEFSTYRWREHCGPHDDNDLGYRTEDEFAQWKARCPIQRLQRALLSEGALSESDVETMTRQVDSEIAQAVAFAQASPFPPEERLMEHVFAA